MQTLKYNYNLANGVLTRTDIPPFFVNGDKLAHTIEVETGSDLNGYSCAAYVVRADGVTVTLTGTISGTVASVVLSSNCYNVPGRVAIIIRLTTSTEISTIFYGMGTVLSSSTDSIIDPESVIPSLEDLLAQIAAMEEATTKAKSAASSAQTVADTVQNKLDKGEFTGKGLTILGYYSTLAALKAAVPSPAVGDCYGVGSASPYDIYTWDGVNKVWKNNGAIGSTGIPTGGTAGQVLKKASDADNDTEWSYEAVQSVNGLTGAVVIEIPDPTTPTLTSTSTEWNQSFTSTSDSYSNVVSLSVPTSGLYVVTMTYSGTTTFDGRAFIDLGDANRQGMPQNTTAPTANVTTMLSLTAESTLYGRVYTQNAGTYSFQYARIDMVLLQKT